MTKRKISAKFSDGYVNTRTTNNPNLAFGYRIWSTDPAEQADLERFVRSEREGFRADRAACEEFVAKRLDQCRAKGRQHCRGEVVPVVEG